MDTNPVDLFKAFVYFSGLSLMRYVVFVALAFFALWWIAKRPGWRSRIQAGAATAKQLRRELFLGSTAILIGGAIAPLLMVTGGTTHLWFYRRIGDFGWAYFFFSILLMMFVRDTLFYWFRRAMHHRSVFRFAHRSHHLSTNPNPWTSYAVHPLESIFDTVVTFVVILFFVPKHLIAYAIFLWLDAAVAVGTSASRSIHAASRATGSAAASTPRPRTTAITRPPGTTTASTFCSGTG